MGFGTCGCCWSCRILACGLDLFVDFYHFAPRADLVTDGDSDDDDDDDDDSDSDKEEDEAKGEKGGGAVKMEDSSPPLAKTKAKTEAKVTLHLYCRTQTLRSLQ
jgi:hypothetical protein